MYYSPTAFLHRIAFAALPVSADSCLIDRYDLRYVTTTARLLLPANRRRAATATVFGGINSPYVWLKTGDMTSWDFFDYLLENASVVGTPGSGFGPSGEGYFRLTGFGTYENTVEAVERIKRLK